MLRVQTNKKMLQVLKRSRRVLEDFHSKKVKSQIVTCQVTLTNPKKYFTAVHFRQNLPGCSLNSNKLTNHENELNRD